MELLAPAGSYEAVLAAVGGGADAVYMGCSEFANARMNAANLDYKKLAEAVEYCRVRGVKTYITVNTVLSDREMERLYRYAVFLYQTGVDGVIVQDVGAASFLHQNLPQLALHASTQMGICNADGVRFAQRLGCRRVVLARELAKADIAAVCRATDAEIEVFVHGALCACYSGYCLMSSFIGRRSGNRGRCAQPCRLPYRIGSGKDGDYLSLKDLMLLPHINELKELGVASLKVEGRMKGPDYVGTVVSVYRKAIDGEKVTEEDIRSLRKVFDRGGYTDGYYTSSAPDRMFAYHKPNNPYQNIQASLSRPQPRVAVSMRAEIRAGKPILLEMYDRDGHRAIAEGEIAAFAAKERPIQEEDVQTRLAKLGGTPFFAESVSVFVEPGIMLPFGEFSRVRREACGKLEQERAAVETEPVPAEIFVKKETGTRYRRQYLTVSVLTEEQLMAALDAECERVYVPLALMEQVAGRYDHRKTVVSLPANIHETARGTMLAAVNRLQNAGFGEFLFSNVADCLQGRFADYTVWPYNSMTAEFYKREGIQGICLSPELNLAQIRDMQTTVPCEAIIYGRLPLMLSRHCFVKAKRGSCEKDCSLIDRTGAVFPCVCDKYSHMLLNSVPIYMGDKVDEFQNTCVRDLRVVFTVEDGDTCRRVLELVRDKAPLGGAYTRGHYYRGV